MDAPASTISTASGSAKLVFVLSEPVSFNGTLYSDITYRRPRGSDMRAWMNGRKGAGDDMLGLMVNLSELPSTFFDQLDGVDFMAFANELQVFLNGSRAISRT